MSYLNCEISVREKKRRGRDRRWEGGKGIQEVCMGGGNRRRGVDVNRGCGSGGGKMQGVKLEREHWKGEGRRGVEGCREDKKHFSIMFNFPKHINTKLSSSFQLFSTLFSSPLFDSIVCLFVVLYSTRSTYYSAFVCFLLYTQHNIFPFAFPLDKFNDTGTLSFVFHSLKLISSLPSSSAFIFPTPPYPPQTPTSNAHHLRHFLLILRHIVLIIRHTLLLLIIPISVTL